MEFLSQNLSIIQVVIAVLLIISILLQQSGTSLGSGFGGGDESINTTRRGFEKTLLKASVILSILFILSAILSLFV